MNRSLIEITRDLVLAKNDYEIFNEEDLMARVDELFTELHQKEDGIYWLYKESEKEITLFEEQIKKLKNHTAVMKRAQERLKSLVMGTYSEVQQLPKHSAFNPIKGGDGQISQLHVKSEANRERETLNVKLWVEDVRITGTEVCAYEQIAN